MWKVTHPLRPALLKPRKGLVKRYSLRLLTRGRGEVSRLGRGMMLSLTAKDGGEGDWITRNLLLHNVNLNIHNFTILALRTF